MTRPIYEPSYARTDAKLGFGEDQLFRRPGVQPGQYPIVFRAAIQCTGDPESERVHYPSGDGGANVDWDYWDTAFDSTVYDTSDYEFVDPLTGRDAIAGVALIAAGHYTIHAQIDIGQYFNGVVQMNSNYDDGQAVYSEHVNDAPGSLLYLSDFYGFRLDHQRYVSPQDLPGDNAIFGGSAPDVEIVFSQNNDADIVFYSDADPGTVPLPTPGDPPTPGSDVWIPGGYDGAWGLVPVLIIKYWGPGDGDPDWPDVDLFTCDT